MNPVWSHFSQPQSTKQPAQQNSPIQVPTPAINQLLEKFQHFACPYPLPLEPLVVHVQSNSFLVFDSLTLRFCIISLRAMPISPLLCGFIVQEPYHHLPLVIPFLCCFIVQEPYDHWSLVIPCAVSPLKITFPQPPRILSFREQQPQVRKPICII